MPFLPPLALTMGDPAGIGGDVALKAWLRRAEGLPPFFLLDAPERLAALASRLRLKVPLHTVADASEALDVFPSALPVWPLSTATEARPGVPDLRHAPAILESIATAVRLTQRKEASAVVTNPINKKLLRSAGFPHPGHTEHLAALAGKDVRPVMMLTCPFLRVVPATVHLSLREAVASLSTDGIVFCGETAAHALRRFFSIERPRLAVAGLNPHAGEGGEMGKEDVEIVAEAVARLQSSGIDAFGPLPSDSLFHAEARSTYDAALCMYHDQALIPLKTLDFHHGVNVTLGLPFIRTSPDHGTAYELAGSGKAREDSLIAALTLAADMAARARVPAP